MTFSRRNFLSTVGVGAVGLSCLKAQRLLGQSQPLPKRFLVVFTPNGTMPGAWGATAGADGLSFDRILEPLTPYKDHVVVFEGIDMLSAYSGPGDGHQQGMGHWLTGVELLPGDIKGGCDSCPPASFASDLSVDQAIANHVGANTRFRSLELGVLVGNSEDTWTRMCYSGPGQPLPPEQNPTRVFERVFGDIAADPFGLAQKRALKKSVLDFVHQDFAALRTKLGAEERQKLELHETTLRDIEQRLDNPGALGATCEAPVLGDELDASRNDNAPALGKLQMDLIAMSFACDLTRVASLQWTRSVGMISPTWLGFSDRHHDLSHEGDSNPEAVEKIIRINEWYAEQFAYLLGALAKIPEGDGTLLDNTIVLWGNELGKGNSHTRHDIPFVLAGKGGGAIRTGQVLSYDERPHNDLLLTLCQAMGLDRTTFGDPRFNTGPIRELLR